MLYKTCSINKVIAQIYRDIKPSHSGWVDDAIEWIGDAIEIMGVHQGFEECSLPCKVIDHRVKLPCNLQYFLGIEHHGMRLQRTGATNAANPCAALNNMVAHSHTKNYYLNPNYIMTSFKEGEIIIYYMGLKVDCDGFPFIPDDAYYREALEWYVLYKMCLRGYKHQTLDFKSARELWELTYPRAQNSCRTMDIDGYELFKKSWLGLVKNTNQTNQFFHNEYGAYHGANINIPGTLVETFPLLGEDLNNI